MHQIRSIAPLTIGRCAADVANMVGGVALSAAERKRSACSIARLDAWYTGCLTGRVAGSWEYPLERAGRRVKGRSVRGSVMPWGVRQRSVAWDEQRAQEKKTCC